MTREDYFTAIDDLVDALRQVTDIDDDDLDHFARVFATEIGDGGAEITRISSALNTARDAVRRTDPETVLRIREHRHALGLPEQILSRDGQVQVDTEALMEAHLTLNGQLPELSDVLQAIGLPAEVPASAPGRPGVPNPVGLGGSTVAAEGQDGRLVVIAQTTRSTVPAPAPAQPIAPVAPAAAAKRAGTARAGQTARHSSDDVPDFSTPTSTGLDLS